MNFVDPLAFAQSLCYIFMRAGTFISKFWHMLYFNIIMLWTGCLYSHALCFCHFLAIFSYISISIGSEEELNVVSSGIYITTLKCSREHNQEKVFNVLKRVLLYRFSTKSGICHNTIKFLKIFIIVFISKLIYDRVLVFSIRILKLINRKLRVKSEGFREHLQT